jgi:Bacterial Ig-like domain
MRTFSKKLAVSAGLIVSATLLAACGSGGDATAPTGSGQTPVVVGAIDTKAPTVVITNNLGTNVAVGNITFTFTFSENITSSFSANSINVTGGSKGTFTQVSPTVATLVVTPTANASGNVQVDVPAAKFVDLAGNSNTDAASMTHAFNTIVVAAPVSTVVYSFDEATPPVLTSFGGAEGSSVAADPTNAANKVLKLVKSGTAELWAGTTVSVCANNASPTFPFNAANKTMSVRFNSPDAGIAVRLKVENAGDPTKSVEAEASSPTVIGWQTLTFNFASQATGTAALDLATTYNKVSIFANFGKTGVQAGGEKIYYIDDIKFNGATFAVTCPPPVVVVGGGTINFDETVTPLLTGFGGAEDSGVVVDPAGGTNKVARVTKSATAEVWGGVTVSNSAGNTVAPVGFSASNKSITVRVWSPNAGIPVRLKVENAADGSKSVETESTTTKASAWETLTFNFASQATGTPALDLAVTYNKMSLFFNFGTSGVAAGGAKTYYFDDVTYTVGTVTPPTGSTLPVNFDNAAVVYTLTGFGGAEDAGVVVDPSGGTNKVAKVVKSAIAELWAGATMSTGTGQSIAVVPFSATAKTMTLRVWSPRSGVPIRLKLEDAADGTRSVETEATTTVANAWQTLTFNFASQASGTAALNLAYTFNKASVFPHFGTTGAAGGGGTFYFDDLTFIP